MPIAPPQISEAPRLSPSPVLARKLIALRKRHVTVATARGVAIVVISGIGLLALGMLVDWWLDLPWAARLLLLFVHLGVASYLVLRFVANPLLRQPDDDDLALMVERARPEFRSRLIAAVQLTRAGAADTGTSRSLVSATVAETEAMAAPIDFPGLVPGDKMRKLLAGAGLTVLVAGLALGSGGAVSFDLIKRALLSNTPVPRKTRVLVRQGNMVVGRGDDVRLEAYAAGFVPAKGRVEIKFASRRTQEFPMEADRQLRNGFVRTLQNVQESFTYVVYLNDGRSGTLQVRVVPRPGVAKLECTQEHPPYTRLEPVRKSLGDLTLLAGSKLVLAVTTTKPVRSGAIRLVGTNVPPTVPLILNAQQPTQLSGQFNVPVAGLTGFSLDLLDTENMSSRDPAVYRVEIQPDKAPAVRITYPDRKEELVTREAKMIVGMEIADDFEIAQVQFRYRVESVDNGEPRTLDLDLDAPQPRRMLRQFIWNVGSFKPLLSEGALVEYWIEARDNNNVTGPGLGLSERYVARVVSDTEKRADLLNRAGDAFSSITDATADQELVNKRLGAIILEKTGPRR